MDSTLYPSYAGAAPVACVNGVAEVIPGDANNTFKCSNVSKCGSIACYSLPSSQAPNSILDRLLRLQEPRRPGFLYWRGRLNLGLDQRGGPRVRCYCSS